MSRNETGIDAREIGNRKEKEKRGHTRARGRREKERREGRESDMVWWVYERLYMCHFISGALVVLDVLHWR